MAENNVLVYPGGLHGYMIEFGRPRTTQMTTNENLVVYTICVEFLN